MQNERKIKSLWEIKDIAAKAREANKIIVTTNGSFDILHYAHVNLLEKAKAEGDILIVLLNSDNSIKRNKGNDRPIINQEERARMISALECVDYVLIFEEDTPLNVLKSIKPNIHVKGGSFIAERIEEEQKLLDEWRGKFKNFELEEGFSTTNIINKIIEKYGK
jgi:D-beta-D-heptose 7-phosphate kinase/D-beta-D-heptose 1-phosphate adenosyltransferase